MKTYTDNNSINYIQTAAEVKCDFNQRDGTFICLQCIDVNICTIRANDCTEVKLEGLFL